MKPESAVQHRYSTAAKTPEAALCCPVQYDARYLEAIPSEVIEKDYGCGDPSKHVRPGETVLDLGSGTGKICFIEFGDEPWRTVRGIDFRSVTVRAFKGEAVACCDRGNGACC